MWLNFRPFPSIWLNFLSHRALQCRHQSHTVQYNEIHQILSNSVQALRKTFTIFFFIKKSVNYYILCCLSRSTITFHFCSLWSLPPEPGGRTSVRWRASTTDLPHSWLRRVSFYKKVWTTSNINLKWPCHEILYFMTKTQISRVGFWLSTYILILYKLYNT